MPKGYAMFNVKINDQAAYDAYAEKAIPTIIASGGNPIIVDDAPAIVEGAWRPRTVVVEFASPDDARAWYDSPDYQAVAGDRQAATDSSAVIVPGFEMPTG
ncbi:MAG TPA: DUF1330 domain-containing protein [Acidimicrobiia bacterium]|nr:DUF1330 domain-containing protein [Acidimicrobiia bacterium]